MDHVILIINKGIAAMYKKYFERLLIKEHHSEPANINFSDFDYLIYFLFLFVHWNFSFYFSFLNMFSA